MNDTQVFYSELTREDIAVICDWLHGQDLDHIRDGGAHRLRVLLSPVTRLYDEPIRWCELSPGELLAVVVARLNTARAGFFRIRCAFSSRETDAMDWRELAGAAKAAIETLKARRVPQPAASDSAAQP